MTFPTLTSLSIENLRGSTTPFTLLFEKGRKLTIIYGENGAGKSTISDAFDLLGNGKVGSLENRGVGGVTRTYWPSVGKTHAQVKVELTTSAGTCVLSLAKANVALNNEQLKPRVDVLRRSQILNLIAAQPADRYKEISRFVDVSGVETSENTLRKLITDKSRDYESATTRVGANRTTIENFWKQAGSPALDASSWAKAEIQKDQQALDQQKIAIDGLISRWDNVSSHPAKLTDLSAQLNSAQAALSTAKVSLEALTSDVANDYLEIMEILKAAQKHFTTHPHPAVCPLCESGENAEGLAVEVNQRIEAQGLHVKLEAAKKAVAIQESAVQKAEQRFEDFNRDAANDFAELETYCKESKHLPKLEWPTFPVPDTAAQWANWIDSNKDKRTDWKQASDACVDSKNFVETLRRSLKELEVSEGVAKELHVTLPRLEQVLSLIERERKNYTDKILGAISTRVGELYEDIHPGEGLNKIVLAMDAAKRSSLDISTNFAGKSASPPQAYFSDSHLDTLGLCVFFALAERENPEAKILVLDDVLGSVDEPHVERIIGMIYDASQKFQHTVVTTHYRPWREKFRWGVLKPDQVCHFIELGYWTFDKGISLSGAMIPEIARLKTLLADPNSDVQAITGKAGVILEALLDFITLQYGCAVPRRQGNTYVLSDLLGAVNSKLLAALKAETLAAGHVTTTTEIKPILDEIGKIAQARNVMGAHFNSVAFDLYPADGIKFAKLVEQLSDAVVCPEHGRPMKDTGSYWRNGGDTRRLHPLKKPT
ncbi:AAA family ATPase [Nitrosomonas sp.]|uniref:AAA family ATPase n=1 Tax=Nitrosomonas sp. TaxID=42353 RepID=UPI003305C3DF